MIGPLLIGDVEGELLCFANLFGLPTRDSQTNEIDLLELDAVVSELRGGVRTLQRGELGDTKLEVGLIMRLEFRLEERTRNMVLNMGTLTGFVFMQLFYAAQKGLRVKCCPICSAFMVIKF